MSHIHVIKMMHHAYASAYALYIVSTLQGPMWIQAATAISLTLLA